MRTIRKARKKHICGYCEKQIDAGEEYEHLKMRIPKYDINERQIGIEYVEAKFHNYECENIEMELHNDECEIEK